MDVRKIVMTSEEILGEMNQRLPRPIRRVAGIAVIANPYAGRHVEDLSALFDVGASLGDLMMKRIVDLLGNPVVGYGKAAVVGTSGDIEHGAAILHPKLGKPMRAAVGGGEAIIPSNNKVGAAGTAIDVPLGNKDNVWSFDDFDTMTVMVADAPRPDEIVVVMAVADGGRPRPRVGKGRVV
ncbi:MAG TPA: amino acid synthesis family protein [Methylomirabilota bacterium]|nr:amino acid synthesis family protein [Methylomirabilota bacterium]